MDNRKIERAGNVFENGINVNGAIKNSEDSATAKPMTLRIKCPRHKMSIRRWLTFSNHLIHINP